MADEEDDDEIVKDDPQDEAQLDAVQAYASADEPQDEERARAPDPSQNPYFQLDPPKAAPGAIPPGQENNPYFQLDPPQGGAQAGQPQVGTLEAAGIKAAASAVPTAGFIPGFMAGVRMGTPFAETPYVGPAIPLVAGVIGGMMSADVFGTLQDKFLDMIGAKPTVDKYVQAAEQQHPIASFAGELAPGVGMFGGAASKGARALGAAFFGGNEAYQQYQRGEFDPMKLALAAGAGGLQGAPKEGSIASRIEGLTNKGLDAVGADGIARNIAARMGVKPQAPDPTAENASTPPKQGRGVAPEEPPPTNEPNVGGNLNPEGSDTEYPKGTDNPIMSKLKAAQAANDAAGTTETSGTGTEGTAGSDVTTAPPAATAAGGVAAETPAPPAGDNAPQASSFQSPIWQQRPGAIYKLPGTGRGMPPIVLNHTGRVDGPSKINANGTIVNINRAVPTSIDVNGKPLNPAIPLAIRERFRWEAIQAAKNEGKEPDTAHATAVGDNFAYEALIRGGYDPGAVYDALGLPKPKLAAQEAPKPTATVNPAPPPPAQEIPTQSGAKLDAQFKVPPQQPKTEPLTQPAAPKAPKPKKGAASLKQNFSAPVQEQPAAPVADAKQGAPAPGKQKFMQAAQAAKGKQAASLKRNFSKDESGSVKIPQWLQNALGRPVAHTAADLEQLERLQHETNLKGKALADEFERRRAGAPLNVKPNLNIDRSKDAPPRVPFNRGKLNTAFRYSVTNPTSGKVQGKRLGEPVYDPPLWTRGETLPKGRQEAQPTATVNPVPTRGASLRQNFNAASGEGGGAKAAFPQDRSSLIKGQPEETPEDLSGAFKKAREFVQNNKGTKLVHGMVTHEGNRFPYAWAEKGDVVHEVGSGEHVEVPKQDFYHQFSVRPDDPTQFRAYKKGEILKNLKKGDGPWEIGAKPVTDKEFGDDEETARAPGKAAPEPTNEQGEPIFKPEDEENGVKFDEARGLRYKVVDGHKRWMIGDTDSYASRGGAEEAKRKTLGLNAQRWALENAPELKDGKPDREALQWLWDKAHEMAGGVDPVVAYKQSKKLGKSKGKVVSMYPAEYGYLHNVKELLNRRITEADFVANDELYRSGNRDAIEAARQSRLIQADIDKGKGSVPLSAAETHPNGSVQPEVLREEKDAKDMTDKEIEHATAVPDVDTLYREFGGSRDWLRFENGEQERAVEANKLVTEEQNRFTPNKPPPVNPAKMDFGEGRSFRETNEEVPDEYLKKVTEQFEEELRQNELRTGMRDKLGNAYDEPTRSIDEFQEEPKGHNWDDPETAKFFEQPRTVAEINKFNEQQRQRKMREQRGKRTGFWGNESGAVKMPNFLAKPSKSYRARTPSDAGEAKAQGTEDDLHRTEQKITDRNVTLLQRAQEFTKKLPEMMKGDVQERILLAHDSDTIHTLSQPEQDFYKVVLKPIFGMNNWMFRQIQKMSNNDKLASIQLDPSHASRQPINAKAKPTVTGDDPLEHTRSLYTTTQELKERAFMALEDTQPTLKDGSANPSFGKRAVFSVNDAGQLVLWNNKSPHTIKDLKFGNEPGEYSAAPGTQISYYDKGSQENLTFTVRKALIPEIEANGLFENGEPARYYKNAMYSALKANSRLFAVMMHMRLIENMKKNPEFLNYATTKEGDIKGDKANWVKMDDIIPQFRNWWMDPRLAAVFKDYKQAGVGTSDILNSYRKIAQGVTKTIFFNPIPHLLNVATHWVVGRGWDWMGLRRDFAKGGYKFDPIGAYRDLAEDGMKAIKSVWTQDALQSDLRQRGAGTIYGGVITHQLVNSIAKMLGMSIEQDPTKFQALIDRWGLRSASDLVEGIYRQSSKIMWAANDMFLTQRILELERQGLARERAITEAERHIPNYRVPAQIAGQRWLSQLLQDAGISAFGRYHYGVFNSYANITKDAVNGTRDERIAAAGNLMVMAALAYMAYPALDAVYRTVTGNEGASANRRGPLTLPHHMKEAATGEGDLFAGLRSSFTLSPFIQTALEAYNNRDFAGRAIAEPYDYQMASQGHPTAAARLVGQEAGHWARGLIAPYGQVANAYNKGQNPLASIRDQALDIRNPSPQAQLFRAKQRMRDARQAAQRAGAKPRDPIEALTNKLAPF